MGTFTIPVPVEISWLADAIGDELTFRFIETMAGQRIWVPRIYIERSNLAQVWGVDLARCVSDRFGGDHWQVPLLKVWRIRKLAVQGLSNNEIVARVGVGRSYIKNALHNIRHEIRRPHSDERQLNLF